MTAGPNVVIVGSSRQSVEPPSSCRFRPHYRLTAWLHLPNCPEELGAYRSRTTRVGGRLLYPALFVLSDSHRCHLPRRNSTLDVYGFGLSPRRRDSRPR